MVFYDPVRLQQDLEVEAGEGRAFIAEPGLIVVPEVTLARMQDAVDRLAREGFFDALKGEPEPGPGGGQEAAKAVVSDGGAGNGAAANVSHPAPIPDPPSVS